MKRTPLEEKLTKLMEPVIADLGFDLVLVSVIGEGGTKTVQVLAQDPQTRNLGIEDAAKISRSLSAVLDVEDPVVGKYRLEVSSPGIDRPLIKPEDFEHYTGFEAKLEIGTPMENGQRRFRGVLKGLENKSVLVETDKGEVKLPLNDLTKAKLVLTDKLIKAAAQL
ncbi:MAG: ribosome maturation factor RimP [Alphaproteobacteria bacterium]|nr:ribosome maturation factor RimP [Alphaproteobacteria bacterium]